MQTPEKIRKFYESKAWKRVRALKRGLARGVCEECGQAGWEVHHIVPLALGNIDDPNISMGLSNLQLLCTSCHNAKRADETEIRKDLEFNENGDILPKEQRKHIRKSEK